MQTLSRRQLLWTACQTSFAIAAAPAFLNAAENISAAPQAASTQGDAPPVIRSINIMNFIRGVEPREKMDLMLPVREQMKLIAASGLPATWLLQFDALVDGPFVPFLRETMPAEHEVGLWYEMNKPHCEAAGVAWRGRPGFDWDSHPDVAFTIGYTPEERIKLADAAMERFKTVWGKYPKSIASWNLDSITLAHLAEKYDLDAAGTCRDQITTDGFTIWGSPIAGYYPSRTNLWSPAIDPQNQIQTPVLRLLGQDPVYYYDTQFKLPNGKIIREPDTMEPVWESGRSDSFIAEFLKMIAESPTLRFAYAQIGQENSFGWDRMVAAYGKQIDALAKLQAAGAATVETMGRTGARFKQAFTRTPAQAQIMLSDPFGNADPAERTIWYQSRFYRANLHLKGDLPYLRDLTVYSDQYAQPFLKTATRDREVSQRLPAVMDGFHWRKPGSGGKPPTAGAFFRTGQETLRLAGKLSVQEEADSLHVSLPIAGGNTLRVRFEEDRMHFDLATPGGLTLAFDWDRTRGPEVKTADARVAYRWDNFDYGVNILNGKARPTDGGWAVDGRALTLGLSQPA